MLFLANILLLLAGVPLLVLIAGARPTRGENLMGFHLITAPIALALTLALAIGIGAGWPVDQFPAWPLYLALPGYLFALTTLPFACFDRKGAWFAKLSVVTALAGGALVIDGHLLAPAAAWIGGGIVAVLGIGGGLVPLHWWLGYRVRRWLTIRLGRSTPDAFQVEQGARQREQWHQLPADATLATVLPFARSFDPEVKAACVARIRDLPDRDRQLQALLADADPSEVLQYIAHQHPEARALAATLAPLLDRECTRWAKRLRGAAAAPHGRWELMHYLECGVAVLKNGGDVRAPLQRLQQMLAASQPMAGLAKELARHLK